MQKNEEILCKRSIACIHSNEPAAAYLLGGRNVNKKKKTVNLPHCVSELANFPNIEANIRAARHHLKTAGKLKIRRNDVIKITLKAS